MQMFILAFSSKQPFLSVCRIVFFVRLPLRRAAHVCRVLGRTVSPGVKTLCVCVCVRLTAGGGGLRRRRASEGEQHAGGDHGAPALRHSGLHPGRIQVHTHTHTQA